MDLQYKVENDEYFIEFASKDKRNETTVEKYRKVLTKFCKATDKELNEIIDTCIDEQNIIITEDLPPDEKDR